MLDFDNVKNDITSQSTNLEDKLVINSFNPIVTFFNFYGEYLPYINDDTNYDEFVPGGIYKLDIADFDYTEEPGVERYTILPYEFNYMKYTYGKNNKLFKYVNFKSNDVTKIDNTFNTLYREIFSKYKNIYVVDVTYFDLFAVYIIRFNDNINFIPIIYLSYRPDIEISKLLPYIYKIYDLPSYSEINNVIKSCNFDYYNNYYKLLCKYDEIKPPMASVFNIIRRRNIVYFKYNNEHYFINNYPYTVSFNKLLLFDFLENLHNTANNFTYTYTINNDNPFSEMKVMHVTSPCQLPEFFKYILKGELTVYNDSLTILKVKISK